MFNAMLVNAPAIMYLFLALLCFCGAILCLTYCVHILLVHGILSID